MNNLCTLKETLVFSWKVAKYLGTL